MNRLLVGRRTENLFGKIEGIVGTLLKCQEGVIIQILQSDGFLPYKRMGRTDEYMGTGFEERMEYQMVLFQEFLHDSFIKAAEIDDPDLASEVRHVLYDLIGPGLPQRKLILVGINAGYQVDESIDRKGVVPGRSWSRPSCWNSGI